MKSKNKFSNDEELKLKRRTEMENKLEELKRKHGDFNLLYDDYRGATEELKKDVRNFKQEYQDDLEAKFDLKFKKDLRIVKPEMILGRYDTKEEIEQELAREERLDRITERVTREIKCLKMGVEYSPTEQEKKEELTEKKNNMK